MKILLAVDDSKFSEAAAKSLAAQFRPDDAEVRVLHVIEPVVVVEPLCKRLRQEGGASDDS